jgi:dethiobiotin synthetase
MQIKLATRGVFITGTDTGVGKTTVAVALVRALVEHGMRVSVMKPIASGAEQSLGGVRNADAVALAEASNVNHPYATLNPYCFLPAISPHIAAEEAGIEVDIGVILECFGTLARDADFVVVEGAGGWHAPINRSQTMADLAIALDIPVVLVVGLRLGCLNHALLSKLAIESRGAHFAGWVANEIDPDLERRAGNLASLEMLLGSKPLGVLPFNPDERAALQFGAGAAHRLSLVSF